MRPTWKEMLIFLNTASIAGLTYYTQLSDANGAVICTLSTFIAGLVVYFFLYAIWKNRSRKR